MGRRFGRVESFGLFGRPVGGGEGGGAGGQKVVRRGDTPRGPLGYAYKRPHSNAKPLYRCRVGASNDYFVSTTTNCEGQTKEARLGWVLPGP